MEPEHRRVLVLEDGGAGLEVVVASPDDGLDRDDVLVEQPEGHRVLVDHVVEEVAARALGGHPPHVTLELEAGLEGGLGLTHDGPACAGGWVCRWPPRRSASGPARAADSGGSTR